jgi:prolyl-tRNA editing enzyme YbaK/EbsC (Cys-tRNA(Pro) deacylase)
MPVSTVGLKRLLRYADEMSKSPKRVKAALDQGGVPIEIVTLDVPTRTAQQAADAVNCAVDQIAKSIVLSGVNSQKMVLFVTAGGQTVDVSKAEALFGEPLTRADAAQIRSQTGFAIGGVSPVGHLNPIVGFFDRSLLDFKEIWAAAGTPNHVFCATPQSMLELSGATVADFIQQTEAQI